MIEYVLERDGDIAAFHRERCALAISRARFWRACATPATAMAPLLIFDEIPTGLARRRCPCQHDGVIPDLLVPASPRRRHPADRRRDARPELDVGGSHASDYTHEKNPSRHAALTTSVIEDEDCRERRQGRAPPASRACTT